MTLQSLQTSGTLLIKNLDKRTMLRRGLCSSLVERCYRGHSLEPSQGLWRRPLPSNDFTIILTDRLRRQASRIALCHAFSKQNHYTDCGVQNHPARPKICAIFRKCLGWWIRLIHYLQRCLFSFLSSISLCQRLFYFQFIQVSMYC